MAQGFVISPKLAQMRKAIVLACLAVACQGPTPQPQEEEVMETPKGKDPHSYARPDEAKVKHLSWKAALDFDKKIIQANATWTLHDGAAREVVFDTYDLKIEYVTDVNGIPLNFEKGPKHEEFGSPLTIQLPDGVNTIVIRYKTSPKARALQWTDSSQTADKLMPFLYTQSQAILARTWIPCQDGPGVRFTYDAEVTVPKGMLALMSASNPQEVNETGVYTFDMPQPIPSYLMALAAGKLAFTEVGPRTGIYAEPSMIEASAYEFVDMEKMMSAAEELYGPYEWGRYDLIVLPPSFPFGGMENPRLTFATPTILAGDRSLVSLVAHELAHSWSGNLVTNSNWNDFWLNEGFTVYFEMRIMEAIYGREYSEMLAQLSHAELKAQVKEFMKDKPEDTRLKLDLSDRNPDDGVTAIAYDKGYHFLRLIEETIGRSRWDNFLREYFQQYKFKVMDTERFIGLLKNDLLDKQEIHQIGIDEWVYVSGLPENIPVPHSDRFDRVDEAATDFKASGVIPSSSLAKDWSTHEWLRFLRKVEGSDVPSLTSLDKKYKLTNSGNAEIAAQWFVNTLSLKEAYSAPSGMNLEEAVSAFLMRVGRRKFLTPIYSAMIEGDKNELALSIYKKARGNYHAVSRETLDELLEYKP